MGDPALATIFENCFPNTLDTTVFPGSYEGKPDTYVVTGDIDAMWLRDSSAQVWPYLSLAKEDAKLRELLEGLIRRQARMILLDPYANAFMRDETAAPLVWAVHDKTEMRPGVAERKWEMDSLCYPLRLAHGYWKATGDTRPFDGTFKQAAWTIVKTFRAQQRKDNPGPYSFQRESAVPNESLPLGGFGNPARSVGMIFSMFRPSDDACIFPLFVPANLFAVVCLRKLAELARKVLDDAKLAADAEALAAEVDAAVQRYGKMHHAEFGEIWAYEVDGYGNALAIDDADAPGLVSLPYLESCAPADALYQRTRRFALSDSNPYFCRGRVAEGVGSPHEGIGHHLADVDCLPRADVHQRCGDTAVPALAAGYDRGHGVHARVVQEGRCGELYAAVVCVGQYAVWRADGEAGDGAAGAAGGAVGIGCPGAGIEGAGSASRIEGRKKNFND